jgi:2-iminobutanoate/2-iminopropanoate deaminase
MSVLAMPVVRAQHKVILPPSAKPSGNWSYGLLSDGTLYVSGMGGEDAAGKIPATFEAEVQQCLNNIDTVLKAASMSAADVVSVQVYLTNRDTFDRMNKVYTSYFKDPRPTRTTVVVAGLVGDGHIEITVTAKKS